MIGRKTLIALAAAALVAALRWSRPRRARRRRRRTHYTGTLPRRRQLDRRRPVPVERHACCSTATATATRSPADSPDPGTQQALLNEGYALAGSSYDPTGSLWAAGQRRAATSSRRSPTSSTLLPARPAARDRGRDLDGRADQLDSRPSSSYGRLDGSLTTCGIVAGRAQLDNYQLDGEYAIDQLLGRRPVQLVNFTRPDGAADSFKLANELTTIGADGADRTGDAGRVERARLALAMSLMNTTTGRPARRDAARAESTTGAQELGQYDTDFGSRRSAAAPSDDGLRRDRAASRSSSPPAAATRPGPRASNFARLVVRVVVRARDRGASTTHAGLNLQRRPRPAHAERRTSRPTRPRSGRWMADVGQRPGASRCPSSTCTRSPTSSCRCSRRTTTATRSTAAGPRRSAPPGVRRSASSTATSRRPSSWPACTRSSTASTPAGGDDVATPAALNASATQPPDARPEPRSSRRSSSPAAAVGRTTDRSTRSRRAVW